jgi:hypothetical protein
VGNEHTLKLVTRPALWKSTPNSLADENSAASLTVQKKTNCFFQHFERYMIASTPRFSRHDVRFRRVNLKT